MIQDASIDLTAVSIPVDSDGLKSHALIHCDESLQETFRIVLKMPRCL